MKYLKISADFVDYLDALDEAERGRLFTAMLRYTREEETPALTGGERYLWPAVRSHLDRAIRQYRKTCAANAANARRGRARQDAAPAPGEPAAVAQAEAVPARAAASAPAEPPFTPAAALMETVLAQAGVSVPENEPRTPSGCRPAEPKAEGRAGYAAEGLHAGPGLPLLEGGEYQVFAAKAAEWARQFPGVDVEQELGKMREWLLSHPERRRAKKDLVPFILRWLERAFKNRWARRTAPRSSASFDLEEIRRLMWKNSGG